MQDAKRTKFFKYTHFYMFITAATLTEGLLDICIYKCCLRSILKMFREKCAKQYI